MDRRRFLPVSKEDMQARGLKEMDFVLITGDAYVDHPSFGTALISRWIEHLGYTVGIISQPDWHNTDDFMRLGRPKYGFMVNSGNIDSMVAHYTVAKRHRTVDAYSPGGKMGLRPDRAVIVYCNRIREAYGSIPIVIGGLEASLRRFAHYDYWSDSVRNSVLVDSGADILSYGMGELQTTALCEALAAGIPAQQISDIPGTCVIRSVLPDGSFVECPSMEEVKGDKRAYAQASKIEDEEQDPIRGRTIVQPFGQKFLIQYPPMRPLTTEEFDEVYELPFARMWHPDYDKSGGVPGFSEVEFSITSCRGCFGGCHFCSLAFHQGRMITARSHESILKEARSFLKNPRFKGYIHDVGGPSANFRHTSCRQQLQRGLCKNRLCLAPTPCKNLDTSHEDYRELLEEVRQIPGIKKVFIRSGIRYDYLMASGDKQFLSDLVRYHVSGQLKVAPEHCADCTLDYMGKPHFEVYQRFQDKFMKMNQKYGMKQYLVPYLMSSHPGCTLQDAVKLAQYLKKTGHDPEQVQDFYPTPGTVSTCMFYTGLDPRTMKPVYVPRTTKEKSEQRALLQFRNPRNKPLVIAALKAAGREDLIGWGKECLVTPMNGRKPEAHPAGRADSGHGHGSAGKKQNAHGQHPIRGRQAKSSKTKYGRRP